jgi:hypothetical protein
MTSSAQRIGGFLRHLPFADRLLERLPEPVRDVLRELRDASGDPPAGEVHHGDVPAGVVVRAIGLVIGAVREGGSVRAVNVVRGDVDGGAVRGVNLLLGDVLYGEVRGVNVLVGDVRGGSVRDVQVIVGDVLGGRLEGVYAVIGDVQGGEGSVARVVGDVSHDGLRVTERLGG